MKTNQPETIKRSRFAGLELIFMLLACFIFIYSVLRPVVSLEEKYYSLLWAISVVLYCVYKVILHCRIVSYVKDINDKLNDWKN